MTIFLKVTKPTLNISNQGSFFSVVKSVSQSLSNFRSNSTSTLKSYKDIPGPKTHPLIGSFSNIKQFGGKYDIIEFRDFQNELQSDYGNIVKWEMFNDKNCKKLGKQKKVYLYDPEFIKQAFKQDCATPHRQTMGPLAKLHQRLNVKTTLLNGQGERWRRLRSLSNPSMARPQTINLYLANQNQVANQLVYLINKKFQNLDIGGKDQVLTIKKFDELLRLLALEYVTEITFDQRLNCLIEETRLPDVSKLVNEIGTFFVLVGRILFAPPYWKIYPTEDWRRFQEAGDYIYKIVGKYISEAQANIDKSDKKTVLKEFLKRKEKYGLDILDVVGIMSDFLIAGVDTTSTAIYYLLYELAINPEVQQKLYEEVNSVIGNNQNITEENIENLKYLKSCVKESMRLHSTVPANSRIAEQDFVIGDYLIPKGVNIVFCNSYITQSENYFKNASKFDPERWSRDVDSIHPYSTLAFGFGSRMCIGRRVAEQEIYLTLIKVIQNYRLEYLGPKPGVKIGLVVAPNISLDLNFYKRT